MSPPLHRFNRLEIDLGAIKANTATLCRLLPPGTSLAAVVKADGYGHGMVEAARAALDGGAQWLAVTSVPEAVVLRSQGLNHRIMVLGGPTEEELATVVELDLVAVVHDALQLVALEQLAKAAGRQIECHLKLDTGMGRLGLMPGEVLEALELTREFTHLRVGGLLSHLATPGTDHADAQAKVFMELLVEARARGWALANSSLLATGGLLHPPRDMPPPPGLVRVGVGLYGGLPEPHFPARVPLATSMRVSTRLIAVRRVPPGTRVSYGGTWVTKAPSVLGVVPLGYAEGYPRCASNRAQVLVGGQRAPVRGRVCMNLTVVELTHLPAAPKPGQEVVVLGPQGDGLISLDELAEWAGTIAYEVSCRFGTALSQVRVWRG